jgi:DNA repair photolyase
MTHSPFPIGFCWFTAFCHFLWSWVAAVAQSGSRILVHCVQQYCYCREKKYYPFDDPRDFAYRIEVKENAPELLRRALSRAPVDVVGCGDYQAVERKFGLSRKMLEVCLELGFPVSVLERSPLVLRDLDLLQAINERARAVMMWSTIYTPDSAHRSTLRQLERLAPPPEKRFAAMAQFARAGILTGTCMMPILPDLCDTDENLEAVVRWTAEHGGQFVLAGALTMADQQREYFLDVLDERFPAMGARYRQLYPPGTYGPSRSDWRPVALRLKELCERYGIRDRMPRPIIPGDKRALNKRIVEALANQVYDLELRGEPQERVWAYRKAAWAIEDLEQDVGLVYRQMGCKGLESVENVGPRLAAVVEGLLRSGLS